MPGEEGVVTTAALDDRRPPYGYTCRTSAPTPTRRKQPTANAYAASPRPTDRPHRPPDLHELLADSGLFGIAEVLTSNHVPRPSAHDSARNPHRSGIAWSKSAVRVTPRRYTGRQVWNKQRTEEVLLDVDDVAFGHTGVMRWNPRDKWVVCKDFSHSPIVDDATFEQAQALLVLQRHLACLRW
ncbi:recombinase family protein [Micromonospora tulbaghiae]|uniref:recombinase family protein n=1 Tax=Micromonospora tulbaghiae TaxID=479978 RepID=UPI003666EE39